MAREAARHGAGHQPVFVTLPVTNQDGALLQVDVGAVQRQQLTTSQAGEDEQGEHGMRAVPGVVVLVELAYH